jgi:hypothetical protein
MNWARNGAFGRAAVGGNLKVAAVDLGIAGWPLRRASPDCLDLAFRSGLSPIIEIPKDLLDRMSLKKLFGIVARSQKMPCFAGTTDFAHLSGLTWTDYKRYLDIQVSQARFLGCRMLRLFLQAENRAEFGNALGRIIEFASRLKDLEIVLETHRGWETHPDGLNHLLAQTEIRLVVDFANVSKRAVREVLLRDLPHRRIAYFHIRNLPTRLERPSVAACEATAEEVFPRHPFLWEPKTLSGWRAVEAFRTHLDRVRLASTVAAASSP